MREAKVKQFESLQIGQLYKVGGVVVNLYSHNDKIAQYYEAVLLEPGELFIALEHTDNSEFRSLGERYFVYDTALVLSNKGLGRVVLSDKEYNDWRYKLVVDGDS